VHTLRVDELVVSRSGGAEASGAGGDREKKRIIMVNVPLEAELFANLEVLELPKHHLHIATNIYAGGKKMRDYFMAQEKHDGVKKITNDSFWNISPKYRFDTLANDIEFIADGLASALALTQVYIPFVPEIYVIPLEISNGLKLACYHLDFGFRLASSGWDRLALLLDLVFELGLDRECNLKKVLTKLAKEHTYLEDNPHLKWLREFRYGKFDELEGFPLGIRHETTHRFSLLNRYLSEYLEQFGNDAQEQRHGPKEWHVILVAHYRYYMQGVVEVAGLMSYAG
jgi:hypothetical protein